MKEYYRMQNYVVIDLEMCKVSAFNKKKFSLANEIIEIGAVLLNDSFCIVDEFKTFVYPEYGRLDSFITNLTHITAQDLENAPCLQDALELLFVWLPEDVTMVAWSENDAIQLHGETVRKGIRMQELDALLRTETDCQALFAEKVGVEKCYGLTNALMLADIAFCDGAHDALVDAHNTALLFAKIMREDQLKLNPYYQTEQNVSVGFCPFADLFAGLNIAG